MLLCNIPIQYKEGVFGFYEFEDYADDMEDSQILYQLCQKMMTLQMI